jgi:DNA-binding response OmpR family regulator
LKRTYKTPSLSKLSFGSITLDLDTRVVRKDGAVVPLTAKEFDLLVFLSKNPRQVYSREEILENVWNNKTRSSSATVTEHIRRLRLKLETDPASPRHLCAVRSSGYQFIP